MNKSVSIVMGSDSDWPTMQSAADILDELGIEYEVDVISAHRTPQEMLDFSKNAKSRGIKVIIAGAGGAAHLPGMIASSTILPVIGVPVPLKYLDGMDSLLSIVQMPAGVPVAAVGVGNAKNAGLLAARMIGISDESVADKVSKFMQAARIESLEKGKNLNSKRNQKTGFN
jgi:5-(carboxyamino)imidazole ribonucleotide mutase